MSRLHVVVLDYLAPLSDIDQHVQAHRDWLDKHYQAGIFVTSGPLIPRTGGLILAMIDSAEALQEIMRTDPFYVAGLVDFEVMTFKPVKRSAVLNLPDIPLSE